MRASGWFWPVVTAGIVGHGLVLRRRITGLDVLAPCDEPAAPTHLVVTAAGVEVDPATLRAASRHAASNGLDALDLVPADLPVERLLRLVRLVDPATSGTTRSPRAAGPAPPCC